MESKPENYQVKSRVGKIFAGLIIIVVGGTLLMRQLGVFFPDWLFTWPMILILVGLYSGAHNAFRSNGWLIIVAIGGMFLLQEIEPGIQIGRYIFPVAIIFVGLLIIFGSSRTKSWKNKWKQNDWKNKWDHHDWKNKWDYNAFSHTESKADTENFDDYIDLVSVFSGVEKLILSKHFKGGDVVNFFGGTELNFAQADIQGSVVLDVTQVFGGTKIIVPRNWKIHSQMTAVFGGIEDKRSPDENEISPDKILLIRGTSIFGGIEIVSY